MSNPLGEELEYSILATDETDENEQKRFQVKKIIFCFPLGVVELIYVLRARSIVEIWKFKLAKIKNCYSDANFAIHKLNNDH